MASGKTKETHVPFSEATKIEKLDSHTYRVNLVHDYCIGAVPNGGYVGSCMLAAASTHLSERDQRDMLTVHFEYPSQAISGPAIVVVEDVKLSRRYSTVHLTLWQGGLVPQAPWITPSVSRRVVIALANYTNLQTMSGMSSQTGYEVTPAAELPGPLPDFEGLRTKGADDTWEESKLPQTAASASAMWRSLRNWCFYMPRADPVVPGMVDMWVRMASGERIKQGTLAYLVDSFPWNLHTFLPSPEMRKLLAASQSQSQGKARGQAGKQEDERADLWFPTVVMNLEAKMALPEEGVEWLAVRLASKQIKDGRFDLDIQVRDVDGELVALSHHVAMIVSIERNTGKSGSAKAAL